MSHPEQLAFFSAVADANRAFISHARVLEIGSYDVNGSVRSVFPCREYVGVDLATGPGVDMVEFGHRVDLPDGHFGAAISGECFEHDKYWRETFLNMVRLTQPGGLVAFTCASRGRPEHGTVRTRVSDSPGTQSEGINYYRNLSAMDFQDLDLASMFSEFKFWYMPTHFDLYFAGVRRGGNSANLPDDTQVEAIQRLMGKGHRFLRLPLHVAMHLLGEERYQDAVLPYWRTLLRARDRLGSDRAL